MIDCSKEIDAFYIDKVALPESMKSEMRDRRNANRDRLSRGMDNRGITPIGIWSQGSYAMHTMVQAENNDFDIDDGVYFKKEDLADEYGIELTPCEAKEMVRDAVNHHGLKFEPEVKENCVRVTYDKGYHIDIPVYRAINFGRDGEYYELASTPGWKESNPRAVTQWFVDAVIEKSPDETNGRQMRRVVRLLKDFVKSKASVDTAIPSGFIISKLVEEKYEPHEDRDDKALFFTMDSIRSRLLDGLVVRHPVLDENLTIGANDPMTASFRDMLSEAIDQLQVLFETDSIDEALDAWGSVFQQEQYFSNLVKSTGTMGGDSDIGPLVTWRKTEEFIEDRCSIDIQYHLVIDCEVHRNGMRQSLLAMLTKGYKISSNQKLIFKIVKCNVPEPFTIKWKVLNRGAEARARDCIRGQIENSNKLNNRRSETALFRGDHRVICYALRDDVVVASDGIDVPIL